VSTNRGNYIGASICDFRLQSCEGVTLGGKRLKSFERDPFSFCRFFERDKACEGLRVCRAHGLSLRAKPKTPFQWPNVETQVYRFGELQ
jgi:hypothetical protein